MLVLAGFFLGLVFLLAGLSGGVSRARIGSRWWRLEQRGVTVDAEVLSRVPAEGDTAACKITTQWEWQGNSHGREFTVPQEWWDKHGGTTIRVRIDSGRPQVAEIALQARSPTWTLLVALIWFGMAVVGVFFLVRSVTMGCDQSEFEFLDSVCESLQALG